VQKGRRAVPLQHRPNNERNHNNNERSHNNNERRRNNNERRRNNNELRRNAARSVALSQVSIRAVPTERRANAANKVCRTARHVSRGVAVAVAAVVGGDWQRSDDECFTRQVLTE
jgi:hypothetical protein